jgi:S-adenosylhomocysteine hydrolase
MNNVESLLQNSPVSKRLNYLSAHKIAELFYRQVMAAHNATNNAVMDNCIVFCFSHLSTTVNLSICNYWMSVFEHIYLIPKKSSLNTNLLRHIANPTQILRARDRSEFSKTINEVKEIVGRSNLPIILFDIGGYFAPFVDELSNFLGDRLLLVLEDTANGHKKYTLTEYYKTSHRFKSVAYDSYKMAENVMVANIMLGHLHSFVSDWSIFKSTLVVGYGRIGRSLCFGLRERGAKNIVVVDADKARLFMASTEGFESLTAKQLEGVQDRFDYCFSMSGHHGVTGEVLSSLRDNSYISVVTSYDDEFAAPIKKIFEAGGGESIDWEGKTVNIVNRGRPINLSTFAAFDARNLSLHFLFGRIFSTFLSSLGLALSSDWEEDVYSEILAEIQLT